MKIILKKPLSNKTNPLYKILVEYLEILCQYLVDMQKHGFIKPNTTKYSSPVLFAQKPGGGWRFYMDYRKINTITQKDQYLLLLIDKTFDQLSIAKIFIKLDIR